MAKMVECKSCGKEVAKSAKACPHCGQKLKKGLFTKIAIVVAVLIVIGVVLSPSEEEKAQSLASELEKIAAAEPASISPAGELAQMFKLDSEHTDIQRENKETEITGQIVQWTLPVYEVSKSGSNYRIQTSGEDALFGGNPVVGTFVTLVPRSVEEGAFIEGLKTGDQVTFKGEISGTFMRNIEIEPAILVSK